VAVDDVCEAFVLAAATGEQEPGAVYNVGTGVQLTIADAVAVARETLGIAAQPEWGSLDERSWDTDCWVADPRRIRTALGWAPRRSFAEGFAELVGWFRDRPERVAFYEAAASRR
jgi:nucleoside-diphosphate-sugar epimerase